MKFIPMPETLNQNQISHAANILEAYGISRRRCNVFIEEIYEALKEVAPTPPPGSLTRRQREILKVIQDYLDEHIEAPTYEEIARLCGMSDRGNAWRALRGIENRGWISCGKGQREIEVLRRV